MVELLTEIITSPPEKASLDNPLGEVRYIGKEGRIQRSWIKTWKMPPLEKTK